MTAARKSTVGEAERRIPGVFSSGEQVDMVVGGRAEVTLCQII